MAIGDRRAWFWKIAGFCAVPPHRVVVPKGGDSRVGAGSTQAASDHVRSVTEVSAVDAFFVAFGPRFVQMTVPSTVVAPASAAHVGSVLPDVPPVVTFRMLPLAST